MPKIDLAKRRRVMRRSQELGHCVCDPRKPCPCDTFTSKGYCPCAGERPDPVDLSTIKLTELVHNAGCASKIAPTDLEAVLARLPRVDDPNVLCGMAAGDDAGIYRLTEGVHLVQTVDVFTPCVDDAYTFGRICAANCLSDIYAMGGVPRTALSILCFPSESLDGRLMYEMLRGAMDVFAQAGVALLGGHSIKDEEIKLGFAITGTVDGPAALRENAQPGDLLVLTKPLGVGVLGFCRQIGRPMGDFAAVVESMAALNKSAAEAMREVGASACTDITGFGLFGHLVGMARHSAVTAEVWLDALPALEGAVEALRQGIVPGAIERNTEYVGEDLVRAGEVDEARLHLGYDAQTSGGLLISVPAQRHDRLLRALEARGCRAWTIGRIVEESQGRIVAMPGPCSTGVPPVSAASAVTGCRQEDESMARRKSLSQSSCCGSAEGQSTARPAAAPPVAPETQAAAGESPCCAPGAANSPVGGGLPCCGSDGRQAAMTDLASGPLSAAGGKLDSGIASAFSVFNKLVSTAGALDERTKVLVNFSLVVMSRCGPCLANYLKRAQALGISPAELDEAAWCAVAMGGAPVRLFYMEAMQALTGQGRNC